MNQYQVTCLTPLVCIVMSLHIETNTTSNAKGIYFTSIGSLHEPKFYDVDAIMDVDDTTA